MRLRFISHIRISGLGASIGGFVIAILVSLVLVIFILRIRILRSGFVWRIRIFALFHRFQNVARVRGIRGWSG